MTVQNKKDAPLGKTTHTFFYDISKEGKAMLKNSVTQQEPGNMKEMHRSLKSGQFCYRREGRYVMMSRKDGEELGLKPVPLREGWKTFQELRGKDVSLGARPDRSLAGLERRAAPMAASHPRPQASRGVPAAIRPPAAPAKQLSKPRPAPALAAKGPTDSDKPAVVSIDKDREVITSKDGRKIEIESEVRIYAGPPKAAKADPLRWTSLVVEETSAEDSEVPTKVPTQGDPRSPESAQLEAGVDAVFSYYSNPQFRLV